MVCIDWIDACCIDWVDAQFWRCMMKDVKMRCGRELIDVVEFAVLLRSGLLESFERLDVFGLELMDVGLDFVSGGVRVFVVKIFVVGVGEVEWVVSCNGVVRVSDVRREVMKIVGEVVGNSVGWVDGGELFGGVALCEDGELGWVGGGILVKSEDEIVIEKIEKRDDGLDDGVLKLGGKMKVIEMDGGFEDEDEDESEVL